jgi:MoaA/NifB/PqqE/SkfB family radical SAM enzyme
MTYESPRYLTADEALARAKTGATPRPSVLELHPTAVCQLSCTYCHSLAGTEGKIYDNRDRYLTLIEYEQLLEQFKTLNGEHVVISGGGEPTLHPVFAGLVQLADARGFKVHVYSNGQPSVAYLPEVLEQWLPYVTTLRFSLHASALAVIRNAFGVVRQVLRARMELNCPARIHAALLADTLSRTQISEVGEALNASPIDLLEIRYSIPVTAGTQTAVQDAVCLLNTFASLRDRLDVRPAGDGACIAPAKCYVAYRSVVVGPFGDVHLCCMRAHLPSTDAAYVGSFRTGSLTELLTAAQARLSGVGRPTCLSCSYRDADFSTRVRQAV